MPRYTVSYLVKDISAFKVNKIQVSAPNGAEAQDAAREEIPKHLDFIRFLQVVEHLRG